MHVVNAPVLLVLRETVVLPSPRVRMPVATTVCVTWVNVCVNRRMLVHRVNFHPVAAIKFVKMVVSVVKVDVYVPTVTLALSVKGWCLL